MERTKMHRDQVDTTVQLVQRLLARQFPQWADLHLRPVASQGTDHHIYRLGDHKAVRLPIVDWATRQAEIEATWLPRLRTLLPLAVPMPRAMGRPDAGYPFSWSVVEWLPGNAANRAPLDLDRAAVDLARFVRALRATDTDGAHPRPTGARGAPLTELDDKVRQAVTELNDRIDGPATLASWEAARAAPAWHAPGVWVHGDLLPGNLLVTGDRLSGVIDFGGLNVGDPACDLQPAWSLFDGPSRRRFRDACELDDAAWQRGRGWALAQAVIALPYYWDTNPAVVRQASRALRNVLADTPS